MSRRRPSKKQRARERRTAARHGLTVEQWRKRDPEPKRTTGYARWLEFREDRAEP